MAHKEKRMKHSKHVKIVGGKHGGKKRGRKRGHRKSHKKH